MGVGELYTSKVTRSSGTTLARSIQHRQGMYVTTTNMKSVIDHNIYKYTYYLYQKYPYVKTLSLHKDNSTIGTR